MAGSAQLLLPKPARRRRASFVLTSLIDVIFLLVIFFMVSSQIVPFSLISLGAVATQGALAAPVSQPPPTPPIAVRILSGRVSIGGDSVALGDLDTAFAQLAREGITSLILIPAAGSTVQDLVSVLEAGKQAAIANVTIVNRQAAAP